MQRVVAASSTDLSAMNGPSTEVPKASRRAVILWRIALLAWIALTVWPVTYRSTRAAQIILFIGILVGALALWRKRWLAFTVLTLAVLLLALGLWPGRNADSERLRNRYLHELTSYIDVRYVWGGENRVGIDCSGLVRRAWIHTLWKEGVFTANPGLIREAANLWWNDASARALASQHRQQTRFVAQVEALTPSNTSPLLSGDLAVTVDGIHVLAYLGSNKWIEADPDLGHVVLLPTATPSDDSNVWLKVPVRVVRWTLLDGP